VPYMAPKPHFNLVVKDKAMHIDRLTWSTELMEANSLAGCGKTSLLQCIALRSRQWTGGVAMNGQSPGGEYYNITGRILRHHGHACRVPTTR
jgi:ABC-type cobalamin/Fe3+-siderophores transport system ATPase subunit